MNALLTDFETVLTTTRSVRKRLDFDRPVPAHLVYECLEIALQAPTGGHAEDWRFVMVGDPEVKARLGEIYHRNFMENVWNPLQQAGTSHGKVAGRLGGAGSDGTMSERTARMLDGAKYLADNIGRAPWIMVAVGTRPNPEKGGPGTASAVYGSVYPAIWSFNLALRARGLGSVITTLHLHSTDDVSSLLGMPEEVIHVALLPVAFTIGTEFKRGARKAVEEVVYRDVWGTPFTASDVQDRSSGRISGEPE